MIKIKFLCCLDQNFNKTRKWRTESTFESSNMEQVRTRIQNEFQMHSDFGWKVEFEIDGDLGATYSTPVDSYPLTVHKISKDGKKVWASYDNFEPTGGTWPEVTYRFWNEHANQPEQWSEFKITKDGRWVQKGDKPKGWPLLIGERRKWSNPSF